MRRTLIILAQLAMLGCTAMNDDLEESHQDITAIQQAISWEDSILVAETNEVLTVAPQVTWGSNGFLVADQAEAQIRIYDENGGLLNYFGRRGEGPGEYEAPTVVQRLPGGELFVGEFDGGITILDSVGQRVIKTDRVPLMAMTRAIPLSDSTVLLSGRHREQGGILHVWDLKRSAITKSFFQPPPAPEGREAAAAIAGLTDAAVRGDTIAAVYALSDSVYLYTTSGQPIETIGIPFSAFRHLSDAPEAPPRGAPPTRLQDWITSFSLVTHIFWAADGTFLIHFQDREEQMIIWNLHRMSRSGERLFELLDSPRLLAISDSTLTGLFLNPDALQPNRWLVGRLSQARPSA